MISLGENTRVSYFKRFRMEIDLYNPPEMPVLPEGYYWVPWHDSLLDLHAELLFCCFQEEIDSMVFRNLGDRRGCLHLMTQMRGQSGFVPEATWLLASGSDYCGTVQGVRERSGLGAIQNLGITLGHRGQGLGTALLLQALHGFRRAGLGRVFLEVTAENDGAVRLYHRLGFRRRKTLYKVVERAPD